MRNSVKSDNLVLLAYASTLIMFRYSSLTAASSFHHSGTQNISDFMSPPECPTEHFQGIQNSPCVSHRCKDLDMLNNKNELYSKIDEEITLECVDKNMIVYPNMKRTCQSDGTWSTTPPVCVSSRSSDAVEVIHKAAIFCHAIDCAENWRTIGEMNQGCLRYYNKDLNGAKEPYQILYKFERYFYFSFMTFAPSNDGNLITRNFHVEVKARQTDVILSLSNDSKSVLQNHYDAWSRNTSSECAIIRLGVYADQILVQFSLADERGNATDACSDTVSSCWRLSPRFFTFPMFHRRKNDCPQRPSIPKAIFQSKVGKSVSLVCESGYTLMDPIIKEPSKGILNCSYQWLPYPFPVCLQRANGSNLTTFNDQQSTSVTKLSTHSLISYKSSDSEANKLLMNETLGIGENIDSLSSNITSTISTNNLAIDVEIETNHDTHHQANKVTIPSLKLDTESFPPSNDRTVMYIILSALVAIGVISAIVTVCLCRKKQLLDIYVHIKRNQLNQPADPMHDFRRRESMTQNWTTLNIALPQPSVQPHEEREPIYEIPYKENEYEEIIYCDQVAASSSSSYYLTPIPLSNT